MTPKRKRLWLLVGSLATLGVAAALVLTALNDNIVFFYSPSQLAGKKLSPERHFRLGGLVEQGSVKKDGQLVHFKVTDLQQTVDVVYRGLLPDLFREGQGVIAEGSLGADGVFTAREVLAKHDENYMPPEVAKALKESGRWQEGEREEVIPELGQYALILALAVALVQGTLPLVGAARGDVRLMALARTAALTQALLVILAFGALTQAYVTSDFSVANVVANSHSAKPLIYKISGVWGNHEGSMLLWALILALFGAAVAIFGTNLPDSLRARVLAIQALIGVGFLAFLLFTSNPFERVFPAPPDGNGLNPLLQDPGLAFHPPLLYLGYVGFSVTYAFAIAALLEGRVDVAWARWVRPWTLAAWCFLTLGIALGSWWAYYILGWGGFWFWDPVENASLMPWLAGTALLHSAIVVEKRDALRSWTVLLAVLAFSLSLLGTFLVRSGVLTSVHAFAQDPARGMFILGFLLVVTGGGLALYAWRAPKLESGGLYQPISREGALILNNLLLCTLAATVLLGTLYPLFLDLLTGAKVSVGPPFFNATFVPIAMALFAALCVGPYLGWKRAELWPALVRLRAAFAVAVIAAIVAAVAIDGRATLAALALGFGVWLIAGSLLEFTQRLARTNWRLPPRAAIGMTIAHTALGVVVLGAVATAAWHLELIKTFRPGESATFAGFTIRLDKVVPIAGPNYVAERATLAVSTDNGPYTTLTPERRLFTVQQRQVAETSIHTNLLRDLYAALGEGDAEKGWTVRLYYNPLAPLIWLGAAMCAFGGFVSLSDRRLRIGAPRRSRAAVQAAE